MKTKKAKNGWRVIVFVSLTLILAACGGYGGYETMFDARDGWGVGDTAEVKGSIADGKYRLQVDAERGIFWSTAGINAGDGTYVLEATQTAGPLDNGFGLMFMMDTEALDFYLFEVSGDGYVWIGLCEAGCEDNQVMVVGEGWISSDAVRQGLNQTNRLRVEVKSGNMIFYVNGTEVGRGTNTTLTAGDVGVLIETLGEGGVVVEFDNFSYTPDPDSASFFSR